MIILKNKINLTWKYPYKEGEWNSDQLNFSKLSLYDKCHKNDH